MKTSQEDLKNQILQQTQDNADHLKNEINYLKTMHADVLQQTKDEINALKSVLVEMLGDLAKNKNNLKV